MAGHQYLHYDSCHADHIKMSIILSQTLRLKRMSSEKNNLNPHIVDLKIWLCKREYPDNLIKEQVEIFLRLTQGDKVVAKK